MIGFRLLSVTGFSSQTLGGWIKIFGSIGWAGLTMLSLVSTLPMSPDTRRKKV